MTAPRTCAACGRSVPTIDDLAVIATRARRALDSMRLAVPDDLAHGVRQLADALPCLAGTCRPNGPRSAA